MDFIYIARYFLNFLILLFILVLIGVVIKFPKMNEGKKKFVVYFYNKFILAMLFLYVIAGIATYLDYTR